MRVLAVGAHPDDVELGAGGTLAKHAAAGDEVSLAALGKGRNDAQATAASAAAKTLGATAARWIYRLSEPIDQRFDEAPLLDIIRQIEGLILDREPDVIYTHHIGDRNSDHRIIADAVLTAARPVPNPSVIAGPNPIVKRIYSFEVPSSTEWGSDFAPNVFVDVSGEPLLRKLAALRCYESEMRPFPHPRSYEAVEALAAWRGATAGVGAAEAFMLIREVR